VRVFFISLKDETPRLFPRRAVQTGCRIIRFWALLGRYGDKRGSDMENVRGRTVLVTGASAGIGKAFAKVFAAKGWNVVLTARRLDRLEALASEIETKYKVGAIAIEQDLAAPDSVEKLVAAISDRRVLTVDGLVNNAGYSVPGHYAKTAWADQDRFLRVMVTVPSELAHVLLPPMVQRRFGRIINVASLAGLIPGAAGHTLYGASKAFLIRFSESLLLENRNANVLTTALCPGFTYTELHDVIGTRHRVAQYGKAWWSTAGEVAVAGYDGVMSGKPVVVVGRRAKQISALMKVLPESVALGMVGRQSKTFRSEEPGT